MGAYTVQQLVEHAKKDIVELDVFKVEKTIKDGNSLIVDVREPEEYSKGHLLGAINVPRGVLEFRTDASFPGAIPSLYDKSAEVILYCRSGARSALAAQSLKHLGYQAAVSMSGGFIAWEKAHFPIVMD